MELHAALLLVITFHHMQAWGGQNFRGQLVSGKHTQLTIAIMGIVAILRMG